MIHYPRPELARQLVDSLSGKDVFTDAHNGLFLAAPRRTGKSTFLQSDLLPALKHVGIIVVYVDLWADQTRDPGQLIFDSIGQELQQHIGVVAKTAKKAGLSKVGIGNSFSIDTSKIGQIEGATLVDAIRALHKETGKAVALIVDEAQHALTSETGENAMAALKSARDQMNKPGAVNLMLIMSGSDRDKLLRLVNTTGAPFYGSEIKRMLTLDSGFTDFVADLIEKKFPSLAPVDRKAIYDAFVLFGSRPQFFMNALGEVLNPVNEEEDRFELLLKKAAGVRQQDDELQMASDFLALKPLEQAVMWRLLELSAKFRPYDSEALRFYGSQTGKSTTAQQVQAALEILRQRTPALVWKSARGEYSLNDTDMHRWYEQKKKSGSWPPSGA